MFVSIYRLRLHLRGFDVSPVIYFDSVRMQVPYSSIKDSQLGLIKRVESKLSMIAGPLMTVPVCKRSLLCISHVIKSVVSEKKTSRSPLTEVSVSMSSGNKGIPNFPTLLVIVTRSVIISMGCSRENPYSLSSPV